MKRFPATNYKAALPLLLLFLFLLSGLIPFGNGPSARMAAEHAIVQAYGSMDNNPDSGGATDGVATNTVPGGNASFWLVAASVVTPTGNNIGGRLPRTSRFAELAPRAKQQNQFEGRNTLSLVDSNLGTLFTLVGEKPSGTS